MPRKGVAFLIEAARRLVGAGHRFRLDLVGDGALRGALEGQVAASGLTDVVAFRGAMAHGPALLQRFRSADVFVLPSVAGEGVPRVIQEAMASSCPVVATDVGSVRHQLGGGETGALVPPRDPRALADAIGRVLTDGAYRRGLVARAYAGAAQFAVERESAAVRRILEDHCDPELLTREAP